MSKHADSAIDALSNLEGVDDTSAASEAVVYAILDLADAVRTERLTSETATLEADPEGDLEPVDPGDPYHAEPLLRAKQDLSLLVVLLRELLAIPLRRATIRIEDDPTEPGGSSLGPSQPDSLIVTDPERFEQVGQELAAVATWAASRLGAAGVDVTRLAHQAQARLDRDRER